MTTASDIADKIAATQNLAKTQAKAIVDSVFKEIAAAAASGAETNIPGFGKFKVKASPAREGRNPATGGTIKIAASKKLAFAPAKAVTPPPNGGARRARPRRDAALEGRLAAGEAFLLGPDRLALGQRHHQFLLDPAALVGVDGVPQLRAQLLDVLIDRHWSSP